MKYQFITEHRQEYPMSTMCRVLEVAVSGFYAWLRRAPSRRSQENTVLGECIVRIYQENRQVYQGAWAVRAFMQQMPSRRKALRAQASGTTHAGTRPECQSTPDSQHEHPVAPNLLNRDFTACAPNTKWVAVFPDITGVCTLEGWLYLAVVLDIFSRMVVGWAVESHRDEALVEQAALMALARRHPEPGLLHHSDRGSQYTAADYRALLDHCGIVVSMGNMKPQSRLLG